MAGAAVLPVKRLTQATEHVTRTQDLCGRIEPVGEDEIGRLAVSFNAMLDALERSMNALDASVHAQRQLVADASHELRTPVTSLRTNIEILQQAEDMDTDERRRLLTDVVEQIEELTLLMNDLIDLARGEEPRRTPRTCAWTWWSARSSIALASTPRPPRCMLELEPTIVAGVPARLERAVSNLIDNAVKYSPPGEPVEIRLHGEELTVRDHGPGISAEDLPHVFDRFYRGAEARGRPGSGLGLAIVRQVVEPARRQHRRRARPRRRDADAAAPARRRGGRRRAGRRTQTRGAGGAHSPVLKRPPVAEARRGQAVAASERAREVRRLAVADQAGDVAHRDRPLLDQQLGRRRHPPGEQILLEGDLPELRIRALQLTGRAGQSAGHHGKRQLPAIVARDNHAREQVQPAARASGDA